MKELISHRKALELFLGRSYGLENPSPRTFQRLGPNQLAWLKAKVDAFQDILSPPKSAMDP